MRKQFKNRQCDCIFSKKDKIVKTITANFNSFLNDSIIFHYLDVDDFLILVNRKDSKLAAKMVNKYITNQGDKQKNKTSFITFAKEQFGFPKGPSTAFWRMYMGSHGKNQ